MKYFIDTEFREDGKTIELISIGVKAEDGRQFYAINEEAPWSQIVNDKWLRENVLPHLPVLIVPIGEDRYRVDLQASPDWQTLSELTTELCEFVTGEDIEFWGYYADYDWVAVCRLFGRMIDLPPTWPKFCYDLRQWLNHQNRKHLRQPDDAPHNALSDAVWVADTYRTVVNSKVTRSVEEWEERHRGTVADLDETTRKLVRSLEENERLKRHTRSLLEAGKTFHQTTTAIENEYESGQ